MATCHPANRSRWREPRLLFRWLSLRLVGPVCALALAGCVSQARHDALQAEHDALQTELEALTQLNAAQHRIIIAQERELKSRAGKPDGASPPAGD